MHQDPSGPGVALEKSTIPEKSGFSGSFGPGRPNISVFKKGITESDNVAYLLQLAKVGGGVCIRLGKQGEGEEGKRGKGGKKAGACRLDNNNISQRQHLSRARTIRGKDNIRQYYARVI